MTFIQTIEAILNVLFQLCVIFPYSALTIRRQSHLPPRRLSASPEIAPQSKLPSATGNATMISDKVYKLCTSVESVSSLLAKDPTLTPGEAWKKLYGQYEAGGKESKSTARAHRDEITPEDLKRAAECGKWGPTQPSELFLRVGFLPGWLPLLYLTGFMSSCIMTLCVLSITMYLEPWLVHH
jgi:hypothetical protein